MLKMSKSFFVLTAGFVFLGIGILHGLRAYYSWDFAIAGWLLPMWVSWLVVIMGFLMSFSAIRILK